MQQEISKDVLGRARQTQNEEAKAFVSVFFVERRFSNFFYTQVLELKPKVSSTVPLPIPPQAHTITEEAYTGFYTHTHTHTYTEAVGGSVRVTSECACACACVFARRAVPVR
jgi:hypothetical protein